MTMTPLTYGARGADLKHLVLVIECVDDVTGRVVVVEVDEGSHSLLHSLRLVRSCKDGGRM